MKLPDIRFFDRFRLHIILQNKSSYITLFVGIVFANILLLFGMMMHRFWIITRNRPLTIWSQIYSTF